MNPSTPTPAPEQKELEYKKIILERKFDDR